MTDLCGKFCPFAGCEGCRFQGGKLSDSVVPQGKMDTATTNGPGRQPETVLAAPFRHKRKEGVG